ncbi:hypothetical protein ACFP3U_04740 [Kitasatospora misakiensis]|uniref:Uncharacterized protein n=1 Tax=Kitasatospora misakiensis TaxID=67330 RepID=A0ABW0WXH0_9ACTN
MPSLLNYQIVTDPTSLPASLPNEPSLGTVYLIVSNTHQSQVEWDYIDVAVPLLTQSSNLTDTPAAVTASITRTYDNPWDDPLEFTWDAANDCFRARLSQAQPPTRQFALLDAHGALVLKLENVPVAEGAGLSLLEIRERAGGGDANLAMRQDHYTTYLGLTKQTPRVPRNFRAEHSLVNGDASEPLVLLWDGPTDLDYVILDGAGAELHRESALPGAAAVHQDFTWSTPDLRRGTTFTLVARPPGGAQQRGYFLTATAHARIPEFESGTRTRWIEGTTDRGRVTFTADGVTVAAATGDPGTVTAKKVDVDNVTTRVVQGRSNDAGWITFPDSGVNLYHGPNSDLGVLTAARADVEGVNTTWAGSRDAGKGWLDFTQPGATLHKDGNQDLGTLTAEKVDVNGINTRWVGDRDTGKGWIGFPQDGVDVRKDGGQEWGTVHADKADVEGVNTKWVQGRSTGDGWIEFPAEGVRVLRDGGHDLGTVIAGKASLNELHTVEARVSGEARVQGMFSAGGGMKLSHDGTRMFVTLPDRMIFSAINEFKKWVGMERGLTVSFQTGSFSATKENGFLTSGCDVQFQQGTVSISHGNPPQVRTI